MADGFLLWSMSRFNNQNFAICGKTIESLRRNVILNLRDWMGGVLDITERRAENKLIVTDGSGRSNTYFLFGGRDESSYMLIQGITLAGVLLDEVALMPRSFVEQALARCSVPGSKFWFNCNPEGPEHWFYKEWIQKAKEHNALHLHFTMADNLALAPDVRARYEGMYTGVFYRRYILGEWCVAEGIIYDMFDPARHVVPSEPRKYTEYMLSCDYGTQNATVFLLWGYCEGVWYLVREYYHSGRETQRQKTDEEYYQALTAFVGDTPVQRIIIDPSAASFIACIRRHARFTPVQAANAVVDGIRFTGSLLTAGKLLICKGCDRTIRELQTYHWDEKADEDKPVKEDDHCSDAMRYFCYTHIRRNAYRYGVNKIQATDCSTERE